MKFILFQRIFSEKETRGFTENVFQATRIVFDSYTNKPKDIKQTNKSNDGKRMY